MIFKDNFEPKVKPSIKRQLVSSYLYDPFDLPLIEMKNLNNEIYSKVVFKFILQSEGAKKEFLRTLEGDPKDVYQEAAKITSRISLSLSKKFNDKWQATLVKLLNQPSENKTILNLGVYKNKKNNFGLYDLQSTGDLLRQKLSESGIKNKDLVNMTGIDEATLYRHLNNQFEISREMAIRYGKALGCDPAELLFNPLYVPVWGVTNTVEAKKLSIFPVHPGEITSNIDENETTICPRDIYRPDVKAIKIVSEVSAFDNHVALYYDNSDDDFDGKLCVVGTLLKNRQDSVVRLRYFLGIVEKIKGTNKVNILRHDKYNFIDELPEQDESFHTHKQINDFYRYEQIILEDVEPEFISPVVSLINLNTDQSIKSEINKAFERFYGASRKSDYEEIKNLRTQRLNAALTGQITNTLEDFLEPHEYYDDDFMERYAAERTKAIAKKDDQFRIALKNLHNKNIKVDKKERAKKFLKEVEDLSLIIDETAANDRERYEEEQWSPDIDEVSNG
jgi:hypothetical protein